MAKSKKSTNPKLVKAYYTLLEPFVTQKKTYGKGEKIRLTADGYKYLKSKKIVE